MLGFIFGFNARLGRLHYFLATMAVAVAMMAIIFAMARFVIQNTSKGIAPSAGLVAWPVIAATLVFLWVSFSLQSMRIRDIGWDPVCVIPGWIAMAILDHLVAVKFPAWSFGPAHHGTIVGAVINFALFLALTFWPGGEYEDPMPTFGRPQREPDAPSPRSDAASLPGARMARATGAEFGRRAS